MTTDIELAKLYMLGHEGGYVNHPKDPGGPTNLGVTQRVYDGWRAAQGMAAQSVRYITKDEALAIFKSQYWGAVRADDLPSGLNYAVADFAYNSGPVTAVKHLQRVLGVNDDGLIGNITLAAAKRADTVELIKDLCECRLMFCQSLKNWPTFGKGWQRRIMGENTGVQDDDYGVIDRAVAMAMSEPIMTAPATPAQHKAEGELAASVKVKDAITNTGNIGKVLGGAGVATAIDKAPQIIDAVNNIDAKVLGFVAFLAAAWVVHLAIKSRKR